MEQKLILIVIFVLTSFIGSWHFIKIPRNQSNTFLGLFIVFFALSILHIVNVNAFFQTKYNPLILIPLNLIFLPLYFLLRYFDKFLSFQVFNRTFENIILAIAFIELSTNLLPLGAWIYTQKFDVQLIYFIFWIKRFFVILLLPSSIFLLIILNKSIKKYSAKTNDDKLRMKWIHEFIVLLSILVFVIVLPEIAYFFKFRSFILFVIQGAVGAAVVVFMGLRNLNIQVVSAIETAKETNSYEDDFVKEFTLKHNVYPYKICYSYENEFSSFMHIADWTPVYDLKTPTRSATLTLEIPKYYKVNVKLNDIEHSEVDSLENSIRYTWKSNYLNVLKPEVYCPPLYSFTPSVRVVPQDFTYGLAGSFESWKSYGDWHYALNEGTDVLQDKDKQTIRNLVTESDSKESKIEKLYNYLQENTRYVSVQIGLGGLKPYPADYVARTKYGDCKALTNYMKTILDVVGVKSYYTAIYAGDNPVTIDENFPSQQFNHVILMIPNENDTTWLECTSKDSKMGYLGSFTQNRKALVIDQGNSHLVTTPKLKLDDNQEIRNVDFNLADQTTAVKFKSINRGENYSDINQLKTQLNESEKAKYISYFLPFKNSGIKNWELVETINKSEIILNAELQLIDYPKKYSDMFVASLLPISIPEFERPERRKLPVKINYPIASIDTMNFVFDNKYKANYPNNILLESTYGSYKLIFTSISDTHLQAVQEFILKQGEYNLSEYPAFYKFIKELQTIQKSNNLILKL